MAYMYDDSQTSDKNVADLIANSSDSIVSEIHYREGLLAICELVDICSTYTGPNCFQRNKFRAAMLESDQ
jgi:hypothetical protein